MSQNNNPENSRLRITSLMIANLETASLEIVVADRRFLGLSAGDWTVLIGGFGLSMLAVLLL
jgi:hypothetical protein